MPDELEVYPDALDRLSRSRYYDMNGKPITLMTWARQVEHDNVTLAYTRIDSIVPRRLTLEVSTVWMGLDHNFSGIGPILIFETMVFGDVEGLEEAQWRYSDKHTALREHYAVVTTVKRALGFPPELV